MPKQYRVGAFVRFNNAVMKAMLRAGVPMGSFAILSVRGRKSLRPIQIPLVVFPKDGNRYLIAAYGVVNWVHNLRAADGEAALTRGRRTERLPRSSCHPSRCANLPRIVTRGRARHPQADIQRIPAVLASLPRRRHELLAGGVRKRGAAASRLPYQDGSLMSPSAVERTSAQLREHMRFRHDGGQDSAASKPLKTRHTSRRTLR
jgi:hypothetical protein